MNNIEIEKEYILHINNILEFMLNKYKTDTEQIKYLEYLYETINNNYIKHKIEIYEELLLILSNKPYYCKYYSYEKFKRKYIIEKLIK